LYIAPEGQEATQEGLMQCSQIRGRYIMNACSNSILTLSSRSRRFGSLVAEVREAARSSSQFGPQERSRSRPLTSDFGRAVGCTSEEGALIRCS
jgi:hypothetical protein